MKIKIFYSYEIVDLYGFDHEKGRVILKEIVMIKQYGIIIDGFAIKYVLSDLDIPLEYFDLKELNNPAIVDEIEITSGLKNWELQKIIADHIKAKEVII